MAAIIRRRLQNSIMIAIRPALPLGAATAAKGREASYKKDEPTGKKYYHHCRF